MVEILFVKGPTLSISPFTTFGANYLKPYRDYYETPFYDPTDANDNGVPDNPGDILFTNEIILERMIVML